MSDLNTRLLAAHDAGDNDTLVTLYTAAADQSRDIDAECFFLTHAYVFALELGHPDTPTLKSRLKHHGRV